MTDLGRNEGAPKPSTKDSPAQERDEANWEIPVASVRSPTGLRPHSLTVGSWRNHFISKSPSYLIHKMELGIPGSAGSLGLKVVPAQAPSTVSDPRHALNTW